MVDEINPTEVLKNRIGCDLIIKRVPKDCLNKFKSFANKKFAGDYGMCIMFYQDFYEGLISTGLELIEHRLDLIEQKLEEFKKEENNNNDNKIVMANGKVIYK